MTALVQARAEPSISHAIPAFNACLPARMVDDLSNTFTRRVYDRLYSPLVIVWCLIFQRLNADHTCDAVVSHLSSGAVDCLSSRHQVPLSLRMKSESTAAYCKARKRLPIQIVEGVLAYLADAAGAYLAAEALWKGHSVALLDGSTIILRPEAELVDTYGQARNQHGSGYWVTMRVVGAFCLATGALLAVKGGCSSRE